MNICIIIIISILFLLFLTKKEQFTDIGKLLQHNFQGPQDRYMTENAWLDIPHLQHGDAINNEFYPYRGSSLYTFYYKPFPYSYYLSRFPEYHFRYINVYRM